MTKITASKLSRAIWRDGSPYPSGLPRKRICGYGEPKAIARHSVDLGKGRSMTVRVSPGQLINVRKEFKRQSKAGTIIISQKTGATEEKDEKLILS